jgi:hypothetical protein
MNLCVLQGVLEKIVRVAAAALRIAAQCEGIAYVGHMLVRPRQNEL